MEPQKVAVFRALQLGDVLCAVPALRALRAAYTRAEITFIGLPWAVDFVDRFSFLVDRFLPFPGYPGLPERNPDIEAIPGFFATAQSKHFDLAVQLHGSGSYVNSIVALLGAQTAAGFFLPGDYCPDSDRFMPYPNEGSEIHRLLKLMDFLGCPSQGTHLEFPVRQADEEQLHNHPVLGDVLRDDYVCVHPGARWLSRRWRPESFAAVADALARDGFRVVLTGTHEEVPLILQVGRLMRSPFTNAAGLTTLGTLAALLRHSKALLCNDTGISHVAAALGVPSVVLCMGSDPARWAPLDQDLHPVLSAPVPCRPCSHVRCPIGQPCATWLTPDRVLQSMRRTLCAA